MAKQLTEEELNLRRTARRRLIGAVALALAVVVLLPMVLDSEPKPDGQDIDLNIPDPEKSGEFVPGVAPSAVNEMTSLDEPAGEPVRPDAAVSAVSAVEPSAPEVAVPLGDKQSGGAKAANATSSQPVKLNDAKSDKPAVTPSAKTAKVVPSSGGFVVQIGAFSNTVTANGEVDKLKVWGFKAYTEQVGSATRVRLGPYPDRSKADEVRRALEGHGLHPVVTAIK
ncbi:MAG: SPOR domain-containing protein [Gallionella sp.]|nr:SPOR domain-containing protein [Gallionella sp.]MDD4947172.1 SPOR domain-containing protein [Gallionella sp.]MDD5612743.1 SPOR domain-containing protein [Gallionella sp.]